MENRASFTPFLGVTLLAAAILMVTMGARQSMGLFVSPLNTTTGLGIATISFAMAVAQFVYGAVQPIAGALADRYGHLRVVVAGVLLTALGSALTPYMTSAWGLVFTIGLLTAAGSGTASFSVLIGATAGNIPVEKRGMSSGIINAGASFGQFVFAPLTARLISTIGWMGAMWSLAVIALFALPVTGLLGRRVARAKADALNNKAATSSASLNPTDRGMRVAIRDAFANPSYLLLHASFFTCGFHIAFLVTHLPGEIQLCGLPTEVAGWSIAIIGLANIAGSPFAGWSLQYYRGKDVLFWMYASRSALIILYLLAPKTPLTFYIFAFGLGLSWLATVPPTAGVVGKLFGTRYLATLFGLTLLSHQTGAFFGAWLGGITVTEFGDYTWMWYADITLAALAALFNLPIREPAMASVAKTA